MRIRGHLPLPPSMGNLVAGNSAAVALPGRNGALNFTAGGVRWKQNNRLPGGRGRRAFPNRLSPAAALIYDLIVVGTILNNLSGSQPSLEPLLLQILDAAVTPSITANAIALAMFIQLNGDVIYMILTKKANYEEKREAVAKAKAEAAEAVAKAEAEAAAAVAKAEAEAAAAVAKAEAAAKATAEAEARIKAEVMEWYQTHKDDLQAAPPPFSENGNGRQPQDGR